MIWTRLKQTAYLARLFLAVLFVVGITVSVISVDLHTQRYDSLDASIAWLAAALLLLLPPRLNAAVPATLADRQRLLLIAAPFAMTIVFAIVYKLVRGVPVRLWADHTSSVMAQLVGTYAIFGALVLAFGVLRLLFSVAFAGQRQRALGNARWGLTLWAVALGGMVVGSFSFGAIELLDRGTKLADWYRPAAERGNPFAQYRLGMVYFDGLITKPSDDIGRNEALASLQRAARNGSKEAASDLGEIYATGLGMARDMAEAAFWSRRTIEPSTYDIDRQFALPNVQEYLRGKRQPSTVAIGAVRSRACRCGRADGIAGEPAATACRIVAGRESLAVRVEALSVDGLTTADDADRQLRVLEQTLPSAAVDAELYFRLGNLAELAQRPYDAQHFYRKAVDLRPDCADAHLNLGGLASELGDHDQAIARYAKVLESFPDDPVAYANRCRAHIALDQLDLAVDDCDKALELSPGFAFAHLQRGSAFDRRLDFDSASTDYSRALAEAPDYAEAYFRRANAHLNLDDLNGALADYTRAIDLRPDDALYRMNRGTLLAMAGKWDAAVADYGEAIRLMPQAELAYRLRGIAYFNMGDCEHAVADFSDAIDRHTGDASAHYARALCYRRQNNPAADDDFREAGQLDERYRSAP